MSAKKTDEEKELEGTLRADRVDENAQLAVIKLTKPANLDKRQAALWDSLSEEFDLDVVDAAMFEATVIQIDRAREARKILNVDGLEIIINNGATRVAHPMIKVEKDAQILALKYLDVLRKRSKKPAEAKSKPKSPRAQALSGGDLDA